MGESGDVGNVPRAAGRETDSVFDGRHRVTQRIFPKESVTDANGNTTNLAYDGFNRLSTITFADSSTEQSRYDPDGDLTIWTNRGGFGVARCYDADNRKVSEAGVTGANNTSACPTGGTPNRDTRAGSKLCFGHDAADRMTSAAKGACPGTALATIGYDALGRRSGITFGDNSTQTYQYLADDRLETLADAFSNDAADNVTLTYGYDDAGRELSRQYSNASYAWSATVGTTSYGTANNLNQYPTVGGVTYAYWPEGPLKSVTGAFNELDYDEEGQLARAYVNTQSAWWFAQTDALGHRMSHWLQPASNTYTLVRESTDGLRPETVMDWVTPYTSGAPGTTIHRDFVLGPDPDEYLAWVDTDGSIRYPMTDREGTTIAQAQAGKAKQISTYDIYGESTAPISEAGPGGAAFPFRYTGQRLDPWTGFLSYKARDYATGLGRFLQPDPAGLDQGPNLYEYVLDDPLSGGDPGGECGGHGGNACGPDFSGIEGTSVSSSRLGGDSGSSSVAALGANGPGAFGATSARPYPGSKPSGSVQLASNQSPPGIGHNGGPPLEAAAGAEAAVAVGAGVALALIPTPAGDANDTISGQRISALARGRGNFSLPGTISPAEATQLGKEWVGSGARWSSSGRYLISKSGLRQYAPPSSKPNDPYSETSFARTTIHEMCRTAPG